jgi:eukaryotic-like serine/threonine-protein kinase
MDQTSTPNYEFAGFRLDTVLQVLLAPTGEPVALPSRAFETLRYLVERSGELVEKSTLMKAVWPRAVVEENNLNQCIFTLRRLLGEEAGERRFILTIPGRGYKFVAPVTVVSNGRYEPHANADSLAGQFVPAATPPDPAVRVAQDASSRARQRRPWMITAVAFAAIAIAAAMMLMNSRRRPITSPAEYEALTDVADIATAPALSPDGRLLAFIKGDGPFLSAGQVWLKLLPDGEPVQLTHASGLIFAPTFTPDGTHVAYSAIDQRPGSTWDTWIVPITGGESTRLLPNASGLSYIGSHAVMYSEFKTGLHLGLVSSLDDRSQHREIYLPDHERGMAHYSYLSPDRKAVLVVEMDRTANWQCRLVPFDGSSVGTVVGPAGACESAAWSPSGKWMYFSVQMAGHSHLWRQRYPDGVPQQVTFGPADEETVVCAPDGRSLLTSLGREQSAIWMHDANNERLLTTESYAFSPWLSADARRVYFLSARSSTEPSALWRLDTISGRKESLLAGFAINSFDVSFDEQQVVFTTQRDGAWQIWIAPLDRHESPKMLISGGDEVAFDSAAHVFFRSLGAHANYLHRMNSDGSSNVRVLPTPIIEFHAVAPDGNRVTVDLPVEDGIAGAWLVPIGGGAPSLIRKGWWPSRWSRDGKVLYVEVGTGENSQRHGRTAVLPIGADGLPIQPATSSPSDAALIAHAQLDLSMGPDPSVYAFVKGEARRNIYRIPLHE